MRKDMVSQSGAGKVGTIIGLIILIAAIIFAFKMIPARIKIYDLRDTAERLARQRGTAQIRKDEEVIQHLLQKAKDLDLPLKKEDIKVEEGSNAFYITLRYDYPLDFIVTTYVWKVNQKVEGVKISV